MGIVFECNLTDAPVALGEAGVVAVTTPMVEVKRSEEENSKLHLGV